MTTSPALPPDGAQPSAATDSDYRPRLRHDVRLVPGPAPGQWLLEDPLLLRRVDLGGVAAAVVSRLDGQPLAQVLEAARVETGAPLESVAHSFRSLLLLNLIEGAGEAVVAHLRRVAAGQRPSLMVLPETRFTCQGSGDCCQSYSYGPLSEDDLRRLSEQDIKGTFPELGGEPFLVQQELGEDRYGYFLRSVEDRCIFLQPDHRCGLHARLGAAAKPSLCRDYPLNFVPTAFGVRVFNVGECARNSRSARTGVPVHDEPERAASILPAAFDPADKVQHPIIYLDPLLPIDYGHFLCLQNALCDLVGAGIAGSGETLVALGRLFTAFRDQVGACPLAPDEPEATVRAVVGGDPRDFYTAGEEDIGAGLSALVEIAGELDRELGFRIARADATGLRVVAFRDARRFQQILHVVRLQAGQRAGLMDWPLPEAYERIAALPLRQPGGEAGAEAGAGATDAAATGAEIDEVLRLSFRQYLFGARVLISTSPGAALLRLAFIYLVAGFGARQRAVESGAAHVTLDDLDYGHAVAQRVLRQEDCAQIFVRYQAHALPVMAAAATLT